jgi:hypothetical protein
MWFVPLSAIEVVGSAVVPLGCDRWFVGFIQKLLDADASVLRLLRRDPFEGRRPTHVRANVYRYELTSRRERARTGNWWTRTLVGEYLPALPGEPAPGAPLNMPRVKRGSAQWFSR